MSYSYFIAIKIALEVYLTMSYPIYLAYIVYKITKNI